MGLGIPGISRQQFWWGKNRKGMRKPKNLKIIQRFWRKFDLAEIIRMEGWCKSSLEVKSKIPKTSSKCVCVKFLMNWWLALCILWHWGRAIRSPASSFSSCGRTPWCWRVLMGNTTLPTCPGSASGSSPNRTSMGKTWPNPRMFSTGSVCSGAAAVLWPLLSKPLPLSPRPRPSRGNPFQLFVLVTSFLWLLHKTHDRRLGMGM